MKFAEIVMERYATKKFDGKKIDQHKVDELLEMIRFSASSYNIQPWKIKVVTDQKIKEHLSKASWDQPQITTCSHLLVFCADKDIFGKINALEHAMIKNGAKKEDIKGYIDMMNTFASGLDEDRKLSWAQRQVYLAAGNAINGAKSLGFDSCPMEGFNSEEYANILKIPSHLVPTVLVPIGYAADTPHPKTRLSKEEVFF